MKIGKALFHARLAMHRNQFYYESVGISQRAVSRIERGEKFPLVHEFYNMISLLREGEEYFLNIYLDTIIDYRKNKIPKLIKDALKHQKWQFLYTLFQRIEDQGILKPILIARTYFAFSTYCVKQKLFRLAARAFEHGLRHVDMDKRSMGKLYVYLSKIYFEYRNEYKELEYLLKAKDLAEKKQKLYVMYRIFILKSREKNKVLSEMFAN